MKQVRKQSRKPFRKSIRNIFRTESKYMKTTERALRAFDKQHPANEAKNMTGSKGRKTKEHTHTHTETKAHGIRQRTAIN